MIKRIWYQSNLWGLPERGRKRRERGRRTMRKKRKRENNGGIISSSGKSYLLKNIYKLRFF